MPDAVLGVDAGTGSLKAGLFGVEGSSLGAARAAYATASAALDARDWWSGLARTCRELMHQAPADTRVQAIAIGGQAPSMVAVDADLNPTHAAITWLDPRPAAEAERLYARLGQPVPVWGSWPAQCAWFAHTRLEAMRRTRWFLGCPDYLTSRLIGHPTALLGLSQAELEAGELDGSLFPSVWTPGAIVGQLTESAASELQLPIGTPVVGGHIDGLLGVVGSGVQDVGDACLNAGTSGTCTVVCDPPHGYPMFGKNVAGTAANTSGTALDWYASNIQEGGVSYDDLLSCVASTPPGAGGLLFLPQLAGERGATADAYARGAWVGLTLAHDRRHLLRSLLEGVAFSFRGMQDWLEESGAPVRTVRCVGGQAQSAIWNQIKADALDRTLLVPEVLEAATLGAAALAAVGIGVYADLWQAARRMVHVRREFQPNRERSTFYAELLQTYKSLYPALRETNWRLRDLSGGS